MEVRSSKRCFYGDIQNVSNLQNLHIFYISMIYNVLKDDDSSCSAHQIEYNNLLTRKIDTSPTKFIGLVYTCIINSVPR